MELIDRYLQAVRFWLPRKQQDDLIAELSEDIRAQVEERAAELGRPLRDEEVEALLRQRGSPMLVANRYLPQQVLIGPLLFPIYWFVLKVVTLCMLIPMLLGWILTLVSPALSSGNPWPARVGSTLSQIGSAWFVAMGVVTLIFAILERTDAKTQLLETWNPRKLPPLRHPHTIPRSSSAIEIGVNLCVAVWWAANIGSPLAMHLGPLHLTLAPVWNWFFWAILLLTVANIGFAAVNLVHPYWTVRRVVFRLLVDIAGSVFFCWLLKANIVVGFEAPQLSPGRALAVVNGMNFWMARMFPWAVIVCVAIALGNAWRLVWLKRRTRPRPMRPAAV